MWGRQSGKIMRKKGEDEAKLERNEEKSRVGVWEGRVGKEYERKTEK